MSASEFRRWQQFYSQEPVDDTATHILLARIATILHNANRGKGAQPVSVDNYAMFLKPKVETEGDGVSLDALMSGNW